MRRYCLPWVFACSTLPLLTIACGGGGGDGSGGPRTVTGTSLVTYLPMNAKTGVITPDPIPNPWNPSILAALPDGKIFPGTFDPATGAFSIPNVPSGHYYLVLGNETAVWTDRSSVDLGWPLTGRKDAQYPSPAPPAPPTNLLFNITGLNSWNYYGSHDYVEFFDYNTDAYDDSFSSSNPPSNHDTALSWMSIPWWNKLTDTTRGDAPIIAQMVTTKVGLGGLDHVQIAKKVYRPSVLVIGDGSGATVGGTFTDLTLSPSLVFNWNRSEFAAYRADLNPNVEEKSPHFYVSATPGLTQNGYVGTALDLLQYQNDSPDVTENLNLGALAIAEPPEHYELVVSAGRSFQQYLRVGATIKSWSYLGRVSQVVTTTFPTADSPLRPMVSPPRNLRIGSTSLFGDVSGVGLTPTIAWDPPTLGAPQGYRVYLYELFADGTATVGIYAGKVFTTETQVKLPPNFLASGRHYVFIVRAMMRSGYDPTTAPWGFERPPYGYAENISGLVTP
jgi:hypothetical protein